MIYDISHKKSRWNPRFQLTLPQQKWLVDGHFLGHFSQEPPALEPPLVRDEVVILVGPDKGKTGRVLWVARVDGKAKRLGPVCWGDGVGAQYPI